MGLFILNTIVILLLISLLFSYGKPVTNLYCGIFGFSGKDGKKVSHGKLLVLGLYNRSRGTDSCGYYYNGNIVKGADKEADFKDFIVNHKFTPGELPYETVMAHTRKSTYGSNSLENAHPHNVGNYVQTHNGTLKNIWELCTRHKISHTQIHVDSIGLAHIIQKDGFQVLSEYEGYAALTMVFMDDPASLYLYHGASRDKESDKTLWEERPLFTLKTPEGLYYSSMLESLTIINNSKTIKPEILPHNEVYLIQNGSIVKSVYKVNRSEMNIPKVYVYNSKGTSNTPAAQKALPFHEKTTDTKDKEIPAEKSLVLCESEPQEQITQDVYYRYGRFFTTLTVVEDKNVYSCKEALLNGVYTIDRKGIILADGEISENRYEKYYFIRGVMLRDYKAYAACLKKHPTIEYDNVANISYYLSDYSRYAVCTFPGEATGVNDSLRYIWYYKSKRFNGVSAPKFTTRTYHISNGKLDNIFAHIKGEVVYTPKKISLNNIIIDRQQMPVEEEPELTTEEFYDYIKEIIDDWSDKIIDISEVASMPEVVLLYIEHYNKKYQKTEITESQKLEELGDVLRTLVNDRITFKEYCKHQFDISWVDDMKNIEDCFKEYSPSDLIELENRYKVLDFALKQKKDDELPFEEPEYVDTSATDDCCPLPDPKKEEKSKGTEEFNKTVEEEYLKMYKKQLAAKIDEFTQIADNLQQMASDTAQLEAYNIYKSADKFMEQLKSLEA